MAERFDKKREEVLAVTRAQARKERKEKEDLKRKQIESEVRAHNLEDDSDSLESYTLDEDYVLDEESNSDDDEEAGQSVDGQMVKTDDNKIEEAELSKAGKSVEQLEDRKSDGVEGPDDSIYQVDLMSLLMGNQLEKEVMSNVTMS